MFKDSFFKSKVLDNLVFPILDSSEIGISIVDNLGNVLEVNDAFLELFGYAKDEVISRNFADVVLEENREYASKNHCDFIETGFFDKREVLLRKKDGRFFFAQLIDIKFNDEAGNIFRTTTYTDITEKKHNELVNSILLKIPQIADVSGSMELIFRNVHAAIEQLMPAFNFYIALYDDERDTISYPYFSNEYDFDISNEIFFRMLDQLTNYILKNGKSVLVNDKRVENILGKSFSTLNAYKPESVLGAVLKIKGKPVGVLSLIDFNNNDAFSKCHINTIEKVAEQLSHILERKKYEEQLIISREKAEEANRIKSAFLTQMSHEIRTPINTILSFAWLLKEKFGDKADDDVTEFFSIIEGGGKRLVRTIDLILNMSQIQNENIEIKPVEFDLAGRVLKPAIKEAATIADIKNIFLTFEDKTNNAKIVGDHGSIALIFEQLLDNAIKYTPQGSVRVTQYYDDDQNICVRVKDTGIGISKDYQHKLFTPFTQEEMGYTRKYEGNGLGLSLVKKLIELNRASLSFESEKGIGSEFTVVFYNRDN